MKVQHNELYMYVLHVVKDFMHTLTTHFIKDFMLQVMLLLESHHFLF